MTVGKLYQSFGGYISLLRNVTSFVVVIKSSIDENRAMYLDYNSQRNICRLDQLPIH